MTQLKINKQPCPTRVCIRPVQVQSDRIPSFIKCCKTPESLFRYNCPTLNTRDNDALFDHVLVFKSTKSVCAAIFQGIKPEFTSNLTPLRPV